MYIERPVTPHPLLSDILDEDAPARTECLRSAETLALFVLRKLRVNHLKVVEMEGPIDMWYDAPNPKNFVFPEYNSGGYGVLLTCKKTSPERAKRIGGSTCKYEIGFGVEVTSLLNLAVFSVCLYPHLRPSDDDSSEVFSSSEETECGLRGLVKNVWRAELMDPVIERIFAQVKSWEKRRPLVEKNIQHMCKTMR